MKINSNTYSVDISTNVIVDKRNIGYSDFDVRMSLNEILKKIRNLEFTFGKASLNKGFLKLLCLLKDVVKIIYSEISFLKYIFFYDY